MAQDSFNFRRFVLKIANKLDVSDRAGMAYLLQDDIPTGKIEYLSKNPSGLFNELEKCGLIGPGINEGHRSTRFS